MKSFCIIFLLVTVVYSGRECTNDSQCGTGQCCQILSENPIMSKRDVKPLFPPRLAKVGTCEPYKNEGASCGPFEKANGYCSCRPGTKCDRARLNKSHSRLPRKIAAPRPGYSHKFTCIKTN